MARCRHVPSSNGPGYQSSASAGVFRHLMGRGRSQRNMWGGRRLAVVMPAKDEVQHIGRALGNLPPEVDLVVLVDDGSSDGTAKAAQATGHHAELVVLNSGGTGVGGAVALGFEHLLERLDHNDLVAVMDGDAQMDGADLLPLCRHLKAANVDVVKGDRLAHPEVNATMPLLRRWANRGLAVLTTLASGRRVSDAQCGFIVLRKEVLDRTKGDPVWPGYGYVNHRFIRWSRHRIPVGFHPVRPVYGDETSGIRPIRFLFGVGAMFVREHHGRAFSSLASGPGRLPLMFALVAYLGGWVAGLGAVFGPLPYGFLWFMPLAWMLAHAIDRSVQTGGRARI